MSIEKNLIEIENYLKKGEEVVIICNNYMRQVELERQTYDFPGKLRIKNVKESHE